MSTEQEEETLLTTGNDALCMAYSDISMPIVCICCLLSMLPMGYQYLANKKQISTKQCAYYLGLALFLSVVLTLIFFLCASFHACHSAPLFQLFRSIYTQFYVVSIMLLLAFLFCRLYLVFHKGRFAISKCTVATWCCLYVVAVLGTFGTVLGIVFAPHQQWVGAVTALSGLMVVVLMAFLNAMFIWKIVQVFKNVESNQEYIDLLTKTSLLAFISMLSSLVLVAVMMLSRSASVQSFHMGFVRGLCFVLDCMTNFWCTVLSFRHFDAWYKKLCCDAKCKTMWSRILHHDDKVLAQELERQTQSSHENTTVSV